MLSPLFATLSGEIERIAVEVQPTTLHCCPLETLPIGTALYRIYVPEKLRFDC